MQQKRYVFDEIGLKIKCYRCNQYYYSFESSQHQKTCTKSNNKILTNKILTTTTNKRIKQQQIKPQLPKPQTKQEQKQQNIRKQQTAINYKQHQQQIAQLNQFQQHKTHLSKILQVKKSRLQNKQPIQPKQEPQLTATCPFCYKTLKLNELQHPDTCPRAMHCQYCNQRIAMRLKNSHSLVCPNKPKETKPIQLVKKEKKEQKPKQLGAEIYKMRSSNNIGLHKNKSPSYKPQIKIQQKINFKPQAYQPNKWKQDLFNKYAIKPLNIKKQEQPQTDRINHEVPAINRFQLDMQSHIRAQKKKGIPQPTLNKLPRVEFKIGEFPTQNMCPVGFQQFNEGQKVIKLKCSHIFHEDCLFPYLKDHISCPVCKTQII